MSKSRVFSVFKDLYGYTISRIITGVALIIILFAWLYLSIFVDKLVFLYPMCISLISIVLYRVAFRVSLCFSLSKLPFSYEEFDKLYATREEMILDMTNNTYYWRPTFMYIFIVLAWPVSLLLSLLGHILDMDIYNEVFPKFMINVSHHIKHLEEWCNKKFNDPDTFVMNFMFLDAASSKGGRLTLQDVKDIMPSYDIRRNRNR